MRGNAHKGMGMGRGRAQGGRMAKRGGNFSADMARGARNGGGGFGEGGFCVCSKCKEKLPHQRGVKCTTLKCPNCGHTMVREELLESKRA